MVATADGITVLRDGARVARRPAVGLTTRELATMMIGDRSAQSAPRRSSRAGSDVLVALRGVRVGNTRGGVDLDVHAGEILAVTGLPGSGAEALVAMLAGDVPLPGTCRLGESPCGSAMYETPTGTAWD